MKALLPLLFLFSACAVVVHPVGGDKDVTPPKAVRCFPDSQEVNFNKREIRIYFDEYFEIKDAKAIIISPPLTIPPKIHVVNKYLEIKFKESLRDSTTYTLQMFDALHDVNEKNILPSFAISFSTGNTIDTAYISGKVMDNITGEGLKGYTVALFHPEISDYPDSIIYPLYLSKSLENGDFLIPSIRPNHYTIYAFNDINYNNKIDPGENMAFHPTPVDIYESITLLAAQNSPEAAVIAFTPIPRDQHSFILPLSIPDYTSVQIHSSQKSFDKSQKLYTHFIHQDSLLVVDFIKSDLDTSVSYYLFANDIPVDTIGVQYIKTAPGYALELLTKNPIAPDQTIHILSNQPIRATSKKQVNLFVNDTLPIANFTLSSTPFEIEFSFKGTENRDYLLVFSDSSIHYLDGSLSNSDTIRFYLTDKNKFGDAAILFSNPDSLLIQVQLLKELKSDPAYEVITRSDSVFISFIPVGDYYVRLIYSDSISRPDKIIPFRQSPSHVYVHPGKLSIRGGWIIGDFLLNNEQE